MKPSNFSGALLISLLVFAGIGYLIDSYFNTTPIFICVGIVYSIFGCFYLLMKKTRNKE
ncbi:AtpZ/AtpI family protein [Floccifex sp.]|uniref:AtpZ/AtpI family protein n=1 Tax=Floccifex sp. TaxID=2815810 RepID=UPI002A757589|nr:AtpZ/AtpI family protein [Floccifex sp.]MDY2958009.1 AtpZ/AtpI family protein [Floccifex sp.]